MKPPKKLPKLFRDPPKTLFDEPKDDDYESPGKVPLFSNPVFYALLGALGIPLMLTAVWCVLRLLKS